MNYNDFLNKDLTRGGPQRRNRVRVGRRTVHTLIAASALALFVLLGTSYKAEANRQPTAADTNTAQQLKLQLPLPANTPAVSAPPITTAPSGKAQHVVVADGDSLFAIFKQLGLDLSQLHAVVNSGDAAGRMRQLRPGDQLILYTEGPRLEALNYTIDAAKKLVIRRQGDTFSANIQQLPVETRIATASGTISDSLYQAATDAGLSDNLIMELAGVFGWDIDFALDIRQGDHFTVVYEEHYLKGEKLDDGNILAAEFVNQGRDYRAIRYNAPNGKTDYYSPDGHSMRKAFIRSPVDFRRISSRFRSERYHPILGIRRPHRGVDYAAAIGTPIKAAGDGKVIFLGRKGGYGRTIILQHGSHYSTLYAHMSGYRRGLHVGKRVKQGQVIGYVGMSGLATGPHLHYEFRVNGVHRNPLTVKLPQSQPVPAKYMADFTTQATLRLAQLDSLNRVKLARSE